MSYSTADCKDFICEYLEDTEGFESMPNEWKRTRKYKSDSGSWLRDFQHTSGRMITLEERNELHVYRTPIKSADIYNVDTFVQRLEAEIGTSDPDQMYSYIYEMFDNHPQVRKDLSEIESDYENVGDYGPHCGVHILECGIPVFVYAHGGDWEEPMEDVIFWTGSEWRGYMPKEGNPHNMRHKSAFGNYDDDEEAFVEQYGNLVKKYWPHLSIEHYPGRLHELVEKPEMFNAFMYDLNQYVANLLNINVNPSTMTP